MSEELERAAAKAWDRIKTEGFTTNSSGVGKSGWGEWVNMSNNPMIVIRTIEEARNALLQGYTVTCGTEAITLDMLKCAEDNKIDLATVIKLAQARRYKP